MDQFEKLNKTYNVNNKRVHVFKKQLSLLGEPLCIQKFLPLSEVNKLREIERAKPSAWRQGRPTSVYTEVTLNNWEEAEKNLLQNRLQELLGSFSVWGGNYFATSVPYLPHVDTGTDVEQVTYKNIVLPLDLDPPEKSTNLILFKQRYFGNNTGFYASGLGGEVEFTCNDSLYDYSRVLYLDENHQIPSEILKTHLSHVNPLDLKGLSVSHILPWIVGSCIIFDSAQIHCSSNFHLQGIQRKSGLSLFTVKV